MKSGIFSLISIWITNYIIFVNFSWFLWSPHILAVREVPLGLYTGNNETHLTAFDIHLYFKGWKRIMLLLWRNLNSHGQLYLDLKIDPQVRLLLYCWICYKIIWECTQHIRSTWHHRTNTLGGEKKFSFFFPSSDPRLNSVLT